MRARTLQTTVLAIAHGAALTVLVKAIQQNVVQLHIAFAHVLH